MECVMPFSITMSEISRIILNFIVVPHCIVLIRD